MKRFLAILLAGFVVFVSVAVAQEWEVFAQPWFAKPASEAEQAPGAEARAKVEDALRRFHAVVRHAYASGGDERFVQRIPAAEGVVREIREDLAYLRRNHRVQEPTLVSLDVVELEDRGEGRWRALTKTYQVVRTRGLDGAAEVDPPRSQVAWMEYHLSTERDGLRVEAWAPAEPPAGEGG